MISKRDVGFQTEQMAKDFLIGQGLKLLVQNYRCKVGELDLVFEDQTNGSIELVFVEVRGRHPKYSWLTGLESVDFKKRLRLKRTIEYFLTDYNGAAQSVRVDIMAWDGKNWEHVKNVWL